MSESLTLVLVAVVPAVISGIFAYWSGRKAKIDEIRINRIHELLEKMSVAFQDVHRIMERLADWFESNFKHLDSIQEGVSSIRQLSNTLYTSTIEDIELLNKTKGELGTLVKQAQVYFPEDLLSNLNAYMKLSSFSYGNVSGLFDFYLEALFHNILDKDKRMQRQHLAEKIMKGFRQKHRIFKN